MDTRWFNKVAAEFKPRLLEYAGQPITYVEIGCWQGASASWVAQNVLTHPDSVGIGIDHYPVNRRQSQASMNQAKQIAVDALQPFKNWSWIHQPSIQALKAMDDSLMIDVLYIDGRHDADRVLMDFVLAWDHLKVGAGIIFDDYSIGMRKPFPHVPEAIEAIKIAFEGLVEVWGKPNKQFALKKIALNN